MVSNREGESVTGKCADPYIYSIWSAKTSTLGQTHDHMYKEKESQTSDRYGVGQGKLKKCTVQLETG
jgi:hypothetical protein